MAVKDHMPNKADTTGLRSRTQTIFSWLDSPCDVEANGLNHIQSPFILSWSLPFSVKSISNFEIHR